MHPYQKRLFICGVHERTRCRAWEISHIISVSNPGVDLPEPEWAAEKYLQLRFGDVYSEADARRWNTTAPSMEDIHKAVGFFREAWAIEDSKILVSCDQGASRSPALAYLCIADQLGSGREEEALQLVLKIRPEAVPNSLVVRLGDAFLGRDGGLLEPIKEFYAKINDELFG